MAAAIALRRTAVAPALLTRLLMPFPLRTKTTPFVPNFSRSLNTSSSPPSARFSSSEEDTEDDERSFSGRRRLSAATPFFFPDLVAMTPFSPCPYAVAGQRLGWDVKEDKEGLHIRLDMPGLSKENVKVFMEGDTLVIKGEMEEDKDAADDVDEEEGRRYLKRIQLPETVFKVDGIKAVMKNGVLKVLVPRLKVEERADVRQVEIQ